MRLPLLFMLWDGGLSGHDRLEAAMFWVGALLVFTPLAVALSVAAYVWWTRKHRPAGAVDEKPPLG